LATGGIIDEPVFGIGLKSGDTYTLAENGPERVLSNKETNNYEYIKNYTSTTSKMAGNTMVNNSQLSASVVNNFSGPTSKQLMADMQSSMERTAIEVLRRHV
jgi:pyocin large subunit-like protein